MCAEKYSALTREQLIERLLQYEASSSSSSGGGGGDGDGSNGQQQKKEEATAADERQGGKKRRREKEFDFDSYGKKTMAFKLLYFGWDYDGFASQENTEKTIEGHFIKALLTAKLIKDRSSANFTRCGRTDKGVSAFGQVVSVTLRSNFNVPATSQGNASKQQKVEDGGKQKTPKEKEEIPYVTILNRLLPSDIRVLGACEVSPSFNARFDCLYRVYKYFFVKRDLDIEKIREATQYFVGTHDFKNFCKIDKTKGITSYVREITQFDVGPTSFNKSEDPNLQVYEFTIRGTAFLWHQVRFMVAILFLVGQRLEEPKIVKELLDPKMYPQKPTFAMASEIPLVLYDCGFEDLRFDYDHEIQERNLGQFLEYLQEYAVKSSMALTAMKLLQSVFVPKPDQTAEGDKFIEYKELYPALPSLVPKKYVKVAALQRVGDSGASVAPSNEHYDMDDAD